MAALIETRCPHDLHRALNAIRHLETLTASLRRDVEALGVSTSQPTLVVDNDRER